MKKNIKWLIFFLLLFGVLGYLREFFFLNINKLLFELYYNRPGERPVPQIMEVFRNFSYAQLYYAKYIFTLAWTGIFLTANFFALVKLTSGRFLIRLLFYSYGVIVTLSALTMLYNYFFKNSFQGDEYTLSRWLMGVAQSPIICLILLASEKLYKTSRNVS